MVTPRVPQLTTVFAASRQYPQNPLALGFDLLTWPFQLASQVAGTPMVQVPDFSRLGAFPTFPGARLTTRPPALAPAPAPLPAPAPVVAPVAAPSPVQPLAVPRFQVGDQVQLPGGRTGVVQNVYGDPPPRYYVYWADGSQGFAVDTDLTLVGGPTVAAIEGLVQYVTPAGDVLMVTQAQADFLAAQAGGGAVPAPAPVPTAERPPIPPNTFGQQMVLIYDPTNNTWGYITPQQASFLQAQGGSTWEFHGLVNPVVTRESLLQIPEVIAPGQQWTTYSNEASQLVSLAMSRWGLLQNYQNNLRWAEEWAYNPAYPQNAQYADDPVRNPFLAQAVLYERDLAENLARRQAIIDAAF